MNISPRTKFSSNIDQLKLMIELKYGRPSKDGNNVGYIGSLPLTVINHVFRDYLDNRKYTFPKIAEFSLEYKVSLLDAEYSRYSEFIDETLLLYHSMLGKL